MKTPIATLRTAARQVAKLSRVYAASGADADRAALDRAIERAYRSTNMICRLDAEYTEAQTLIAEAEVARGAAIPAGEATRRARLQARLDVARELDRPMRRSDAIVGAYARELAVHGAGDRP